MAGRKRPRQRARITEEQVFEMMRLQRQGESIQDIARAIGCHRQTVRMHLNKNLGEILRNEARKQVMIEAIRQHFRELAEFAGKGFKGKFQRSPKEGISQGSRVFFPGALALPGMGSPLYMAAEWSRLHDISSRDWHLMEALKEHKPESAIWDRWKEWDKRVGGYHDIGRDFRDWLNKRVERDLEIVFAVGSDTLEAAIQPWLFGNMLRQVEGEAYDRLKVVRRKDREDWVSCGTVIMRVKDGREIFERLEAILEEAQGDYMFGEMNKRTAEVKERQPELDQLAKEAILALEALEMMVAYPGRCDLCPV